MTGTSQLTMSMGIHRFSIFPGDKFLYSKYAFVGAGNCAKRTELERIRALD